MAISQKILPVGVQNFESLIKDGYLYVDKTQQIWNLTHAGRHYFLSRPRRFGKTMAANMIAYIVCSIISYFVLKRYVFRREGSLYKHLLIYLLSFLLNNFCLYFFVEWLHLNYSIAPFCVLFVTFMLNFFLSRNINFKSNNSNLDHTFVVCAYKESPYLKDCIESLLQQSVQSNVMIATSTPNSYIEAISKEYNLELKVNPEAKGIGYDFEFALNCGNTTYVTIAHQDDLYEKDYAKKVLESMDESTIISFTDYYEIHHGNKIDQNTNLKIKKILCSPLKNKKRQSMRFFKRFALAFGNGICCPSVTFNTKKIEANLFISDMKSNIDWLAWEKLSKKDGRFNYIPVALMSHRIHEDSETSKVIANNARFQEDYYMFKFFHIKLVAYLLAKFYSLSEKNNES